MRENLNVISGLHSAEPDQNLQFFCCTVFATNQYLMGLIDIIKPLLSTDALRSSTVDKPLKHYQLIVGNAGIRTRGSLVRKRERYPPR